MPPSLAMALGSDQGRFYAPSLDLTVHFLRDTGAEWLCAHSTCRATRGGYATADMELWDGDRRLVAPLKAAGRIVGVGRSHDL